MELTEKYCTVPTSIMIKLSLEDDQKQKKKKEKNIAMQWNIQNPLTDATTFFS